MANNEQLLNERSRITARVNLLQRLQQEISSINSADKATALYASLLTYVSTVPLPVFRNTLDMVTEQTKCTLESVQEEALAKARTASIKEISQKHNNCLRAAEREAAANRRRSPSRGRSSSPDCENAVSP